MGASKTGRNTDYRSKWIIRKPASLYRIPGFVAKIMNIYIYIYMILKLVKFSLHVCSI